MPSDRQEERQIPVERAVSLKAVWRVGVVVLGYFAYVAAVALLPLGARAHASTGEPLDPQVQAGQVAWRNNACTSCHSIYGVGGHTGPDLTNVTSRMGEEYIRTVLKDGVRAMPAIELSDDETNAIVAYLGHADVTGVYPPRNAFVSVFGVGR